MNKAELIDMIEKLAAKQKAAKATLKTETELKQIAHTKRYIKRIASVCDRLVFNFNMQPASAEFLENTIAEAELFLEY